MAHEKVPKDRNRCNPTFSWSGEWPLRSSISFACQIHNVHKTPSYLCIEHTKSLSYLKWSLSAPHMSQPHMPQLRNINIRGRIRARNGGRACDCGPLQEIEISNSLSSHNGESSLCNTKNFTITLKLTSLLFKRP